MAATKVYDSNQVQVFVAGVPIVGGWADGEFITIERDNPAFSDVVGTDGEVTRSKSNDNRATVTIKLMQTSESNQVLSSLHNEDKNQPNGAGIGPLRIADLNGTSLHEAESSWIMNMPSVAYDREATPREWEIRVGDLIDFIAGT